MSRCLSGEGFSSPGFGLCVPSGFVPVAAAPPAEGSLPALLLLLRRLLGDTLASTLLAAGGMQPQPAELLVPFDFLGGQVSTNGSCNSCQVGRSRERQRQQGNRRQRRHENLNLMNDC